MADAPKPAAGDGRPRDVRIGDDGYDSPIAAPRASVEYHPLANLFPLIEGAEFDEFVADVRVHGVREADLALRGARFSTAATANAPPPRRASRVPTRTYEGDDPARLRDHLNLKRRHLNESQRAMVAAKLATIRLGENQHTIGSANLPTHRAAELLNVSERTVRHARDVREGGAPELVRAVETGAVSVSAAADMASLPVEVQRELLAHCDPREVKRVAQALHASERSSGSLNGSHA